MNIKSCQSSSSMRDLVNYSQDDNCEKLNRKQRNILKRIIHARTKRLGLATAPFTAGSYQHQKAKSLYDCRSTTVCRASGAMPLPPKPSLTALPITGNNFVSPIIPATPPPVERVFIRKTEEEIQIERKYYRDYPTGL